MSGSFNFVDSSSYELSDNVLLDFVDYSRSRTIQNEQQFSLVTLSYTTGFLGSPKHNTPFVLIGTPGSGKSHIMNAAEALWPKNYLYTSTSGTDKAIIYDDDWPDVGDEGPPYFASLDELQKMSDAVIEILKGLHGGEDEEYEHSVTQGSVAEGFKTQKVAKKSLPFGFLYAQWDSDFELWDRLLKIPVHESVEKNEAVARMQWDHSNISFEDEDINYIYDFAEGAAALEEHIESVPKNVWVKIPAGEEEFGWNAFEMAKQIFNIRRSESNRVSSHIVNLVRASALLNYRSRDIRKIHVKNDGEKEAIIAEPQDLANVLACRDVLLATTHHLDRRRKAVCLAIQQAGGTKQAADIQSIQDYLKKTNTSFVKRSEIENMLDDLQENYLVEKLPNAGDQGKTLYQFQGWESLGKFEIDDEFRRVFDGCHDPFTGDSFIETAKRINDELSPKASDFMSRSAVQTDSDGSQKTLTGGSAETVEVDLDPHEEAVYEALKDTVDGLTLDNLDEHDPSTQELCGVVPMGESVESSALTGSIFDPDHRVWSFGPDEWVTSSSDAEAEISKAIRKLSSTGVLKRKVHSWKDGEPVEMTVTITDIE